MQALFRCDILRKNRQNGENAMLLTEQLDRMPPSDWDLFFAAQRALPYFADLDDFVTEAVRSRTAGFLPNTSHTPKHAAAATTR